MRAGRLGCVRGCLFAVLIVWKRCQETNSWLKPLWEPSVCAELWLSLRMWALSTWAQWGSPGLEHRAGSGVVPSPSCFAVVCLEMLRLSGAPHPSSANLTVGTIAENDPELCLTCFYIEVSKLQIQHKFATLRYLWSCQSLLNVFGLKGDHRKS